MSQIDIYETDLRDLENLLMFNVPIGDADALHDGLVVAVKKMRVLEARIDALTKSVESIKQMIVDLQELK